MPYYPPKLVTPVSIANGGTNASTASITSFNNITGLSAAGTTGTTSTNLVFSTSPSLTTPTLGVATATSLNKLTITAPTTSATLTVADGKTLTIDNTLEFAGTDSTKMTFPSSSDTVVTLAATQTLTSKTLTNPAITWTNNTVTAASLATNAITLGYVAVTTSQTGITSATATQVTTLSQAVTVPAGGRQLEIEAHIPNATITAGAPASVFISLWDGTVGSGTQLQEDAYTLNSNTFIASYTVKAYPTPAAGSKTYNVGVRINNGATTSLVFSATAPGTLIVKAI